MGVNVNETGRNKEPLGLNCSFGTEVEVISDRYDGVTRDGYVSVVPWVSRSIQEFSVFDQEIAGWGYSGLASQWCQCERKQK